MLSGFKIAVDDARGVRGRQTHQDLLGKRHELARRESTLALNARRERLAVEELHDHEAVVVGQRAEVEHLENVIAADAAGRLRFALEPLHRLGVGRGGRVQDLDGDAAPNANVLALVHGAHAAFADQADDAVLTLDNLADFERHEGSLKT